MTDRILIEYPFTILVKENKGTVNFMVEGLPGCEYYFWYSDMARLDSNKALYDTVEAAWLNGEYEAL